MSVYLFFDLESNHRFLFPTLSNGISEAALQNNCNDTSRVRQGVDEAIG
jgi:hypothetical protein